MPREHYYCLRHTHLQKKHISQLQCCEAGVCIEQARVLHRLAEAEPFNGPGLC